jgi:predicted permease
MMIDSPVQDLRYALRQLRRSPGFTAVAVLTLALGIGANTAVFSTLNALLLKMLPVQDPEHLYEVALVNGGTQPPDTDGTGQGNTSFSFPVFQALRQQSGVLSELIAHVPLAVGKVPVRYGHTPAEKAGEEVSANYFSGLKVQLLRGSGFSEADESNHNNVVVLSYGFWTEAFSRNPAALGQSLYIKGVPFTIIGVAMPGFYGVEPAGEVDFWVPLQIRSELTAWGVPASTHTLYGSPKWWAVPMVARLRPGITPAQAEQALQPAFWQAATQPLGSLDPKIWPAHLGFKPLRGIGDSARNYRKPVAIMMALVGLVLLIACTNVALLILARNAAREHEFAVRVAIGAAASRVFRQLLTESFVLVASGGVLGWLLAHAVTKALAAWAMIDAGFSPDRNVLLFTLSIATLTALVFALVPLKTTLLISIDRELKTGSRKLTRNRALTGTAIVAMQIAMCLALLVASCLSVRSLRSYQRQNLGIEANQLLVFDLNPQGLANDIEALSFYQRLLDRIKAIPGVEAASLARFRPGSGWYQTGGITLDGVDMRQDAPPHVSVIEGRVGPDYFHTTGIPVLEGRDISERDTPSSPAVAVVNETFEKRFLRYGALGHRLGKLPGSEIVGVVKDSKTARVREPQLPAVYYPLSQGEMLGQMTVEVRTAGDPVALIPAMRRAVEELDPNLPLQKPMSQAAQFAETYVTPRLFARLALGFGFLSVVLVASGLYGTLAYRVRRRTGEIGVRLALGAPRASVMSMVFSESLRMLGVGVACGLPLSCVLSCWLRSQLYQLSYLDRTSFVVATAVTCVVAIASAVVPASRAMKIDPIDALRYE